MLVRATDQCSHQRLINSPIMFAEIHARALQATKPTNKPGRGWWPGVVGGCVEAKPGQPPGDQPTKPGKPPGDKPTKPGRGANHETIQGWPGRAGRNRDKPDLKRAADPSSPLRRARTETSARADRGSHRATNRQNLDSLAATNRQNLDSLAATNRQNLDSLAATNRQDFKGWVGGCYSGFLIWICDVAETASKPRRNRVGTATKPRRFRQDSGETQSSDVRDNRDIM